MKYTCLALALVAALMSCSKPAQEEPVNEEPSKEEPAEEDPAEKEPEEETVPSDTVLTEIASTIKLSISEPSSLVWNKTKTALFVVSDGGEIAEIRPGSGAKKAILFSKNGYDWEAICMDRQNDVVYAIKEKGNVVYSFTGTDYKTCDQFYDVTIPDTQDGSNNYGCEGMEYAGGILYLGNQHNPCLIQTVDMASMEVTGNISIPFVTLISDLCYDATDNTMWILESNARKEDGNEIPKLYNCSLPDFNLRYTVTLPSMVQAEGLEIDRKNGKIYVCCDNTANLYTINYDFK